MSIEMQKQILRQKRLEKGLLKKDLGPRYADLENGKIPIGRTRFQTSYPIIQALGLTMDDLEKIFR